MAKKSRKKTNITATKTDKVYEWLNSRGVTIFLLFGVLLTLMVLYKPMVFEGLDVTGSDEVSGIGTTHQVNEFTETTGERALWNPFVFGGMPRYHRYGTVVNSLDTLMTALNPVLAWQVIFLWFGAIGMFLLAKWLGCANVTGVLGGLAFALMPHFQALITVGHATKLRAIMWIPWVLLTFLYFVNKRNLLSVLLFAFIFTMQFRTQHYQIIFYTLLLLLFTGIGTYIKLIVEKDWKEFGKGNALLIGAIVLVFMMVAHPLLSIREYTPHSTRGGGAVTLNAQQDARDQSGVGFDYATNWSFSVGEYIDLFVPKFHGGTSQETYTGNAVPQLQNQRIPAYWGQLPFTQSYEYLGIILFALAIVGVVFRWKQPYVKSLFVLTLFALLLSLGRNFEPLYRFFFYNVPYFDKFRAPTMILTLVMFNISVLAIMGFDTLVNLEYNDKSVRKKLYIISGALGLFLFGTLLLASNFSFTAPGEAQQYLNQYGQAQGQQVINMLRDIRHEIMVDGLLRTILFLGGIVAFVFLYARRWIGAGLMVIVFIFLGGLDVGLLSASFLEGKFAPRAQVEQQVYSENALDQVIQQDESLFRVVPLTGNITQDTRWSYYYQSLGGYSAAKLQVIQDIFTNNFFNGAGSGLPFNLSVVNMFNGKYIVANGQVTHPDLEFLRTNQNQNMLLYQNHAALPRAFFVEDFQVITDGAQRLRMMNTEAFDPAVTALLEKEPSQQFSSPDSSRVRVTHYDPNEISYEIYTDNTGLLVLSEVYYPEGWTATLDGEQTLEIYKTNHVLRSMIIPEGEHTLHLTFRPQAYTMGTTLSWIGFLVTYLGIVGLGIFLYREQIKQKISGVINQENE